MACPLATKLPKTATLIVAVFGDYSFGDTLLPFRATTVAENGNKVSPFRATICCRLGQQRCRFRQQCCRFGQLCRRFRRLYLRQQFVAVFGNFVASVDMPLH